MGTLEQWEKDLLGQVEPKEVQRSQRQRRRLLLAGGRVVALPLVGACLAVQSWAVCYNNPGTIGVGYVNTQCYTSRCLEPDFGLSGALCSDL